MHYNERPMVDFAALTAPRLVSPGRYALEVPDGWQQGRGAFGGFSLASFVRAMESSEDTLQRPLRSLTAELIAPVLEGPADVIVEPLRRGSGTTTIAARISQAGEIAAHAVGIFARSRDDFRYLESPRPEAPPFSDSPLLEGLAPPFARYFEYRNLGAPPFAGQKPEVLTWVRPRFDYPSVDAAFVAALADATWPALFPALREFKIMGTISFMLQLFGPFDGLDPAAPLLHRGRVLAAGGGYSAETRELWTADGRLLCLNHQTFATIR